MVRTLFGLCLYLLASACLLAQEGAAVHSAVPATIAADTVAQKTPGEADELRDRVRDIEVDIRQVQALGRHLERAPELDKEAIMLRRDTLGFGLLEDLSALALSIAELPEDDPVRLEVTELLRVDYAGMVDTVFGRTREIGQRISEYSARAEQASGVEKLTIEAYLEQLRQLRMESYEAAANLIIGRAALGLNVDDFRAELEEELYIRAETLVGQLRFTGAGGDELQLRLRDDPANAELQSAMRAVAVSHSESLRRLEGLSSLMGRLDMDNGIYKTELLQQGQSISVRDFDLDVFFALVKSGWKNLRKDMSEKAPDFLLNGVFFLVILVVFRGLSHLVSNGVRVAGERSGGDMSTLSKDVLASVSGGGVMLIGIFVALSQVGISVGPMLAGLGVAGFIVGFALQDTLGNFAAGGMILIYRPYDVDDFVEVAGASGLVKKMSLVSTTITTFDNQTLVVPNSKIWGDVIKNVTAQKVRRVDLEFGISYSDDIDHAENVLRDVVENHEKTLSKPEAVIRVHTLGDSSVNLIVRPWVKTADYWEVYWDITKQVKLRFDAEGISIPFPQRDLHHYHDGAVAPPQDTA